jgi:hypothetical protein
LASQKKECFELAAFTGEQVRRFQVARVDALAEVQQTQQSPALGRQPPMR